MADYNSSFTGAQIDAGITKANSAQQPPVEGPFVDGDKTKLDGIEAGADVTDTANVTAAGALMGSEVTNLAAVKAFDPTDYATAAQGGLADTAVQPGDDANTLGSGAATDGYVLTADGVGGAAWEVASGGGADDYIRTRAGSIQDLFNMADTWNDGATTFAAIKMDVTDTASAAGSLLMDLQVGGSSKFSVRKSGDIFSAGSKLQFETGTVAIYSGTGGGGAVDISGIGTIDTTALRVAYSSITIAQRAYIGFTSGSSINSGDDTRLYRDAAGTLAQRNGTNAQSFNLYNTYTDASNYERGFMRWNANVLEIGTEAAGAGTVRAVRLPSGVRVGTFAFSTLGSDRIASTFDWAYQVRLSTDNTHPLKLGAGSRVSWTSAYTYNTPDTGLSRASAGVVKVTDGSTGTGELIFIVPTTDPAIAGALWNNAGILSISAG